MGRHVATQIDLVVEIYGEDDRLRSDANFAPISFIDLERFIIDDISPAVVFEIPRHFVSPFDSRFEQMV
jgi:hypothetical protein